MAVISIAASPLVVITGSNTFHRHRISATVIMVVMTAITVTASSSPPSHWFQHNLLRNHHHGRHQQRRITVIIQSVIVMVVISITVTSITCSSSFFGRHSPLQAPSTFIVAWSQPPSFITRVSSGVDAVAGRLDAFRVSAAHAVGGLSRRRRRRRPWCGRRFRWRWRRRRHFCIFQLFQSALQKVGCLAEGFHLLSQGDMSFR